MAIPKDLILVETAIEQASGLLDVLFYLRDTATANDRANLHSAEGWLVMSIADCVNAARLAHGSTFRRYISNLNERDTP
jgi:hypothetical protein